MKELDIINLKRIAKEMRKTVLEMVYTAGSGHMGGSLSACEILVALYYCILNVYPSDSNNPDRDRFILSKGHAAPIYYAILSDKGYFPKKELQNLRRTGSMLQGHPDMKKVPGVDISSGSLGMGISFGIGTALGSKRSDHPFHVFVLTGCGELDEGQNWEAFMAAHKFKLNNLTVIIDYNKVQLDGTNDEIMPIADLTAKLKAFKWNVVSCDGHDFTELLETIQKAKDFKEGPSVIIANTVKGKGISFMENQHSWHGKNVDTDTYKKALKELDEIVID